MDILKSHSYIRALWSLLPFFLLHLSSGLSGSFTTILIEQFGRLYKEDSANQNGYETLLGTLEDYCPIFVAILGGFLQQLFGPKKILIAAGIPNFISWILIAIDPTSLYFLLGSRLLAGFSNGLLTGNVYMADISPSKYITSFKSIEAASRSMGAILMFAIAIIFNKYGFRYVVIVASIFPMFGLIGIVFSQESPIFQERVKEIRISVESQESGEKHPKSFSDRWIEAKKMLKIPVKSPAVYQPMILIICALCIQHFSGFTFTKKFLLQVLKSPTHHGFSNSSSLNETKLLEEIDINGYDEKAYMFAMLINFIRFFSNVMMARFLRTLRMRFLYFISLFSTSLCLVILGFLVEGKILAPYFSPEADQYLKVLVLGVHVFCVQFGLQTLQGQLTDVLLPSSSKAIMKGFIRAIQALTLIVFVIIMKQFPDYVSFWIMATGLIFVCPLLYTFIPELKNLGRTSGEYFFLPCQTLFYVVLPVSDAKKMWMDAFRKISTTMWISHVIKNQNQKKQQLLRLKSYVAMCNKATNTTFLPDTLETIHAEERLKKLNRNRVTFVTNILGQTGFLSQNYSKSRICIGRGPITFPDGPIRKGGIFLFDDLVIVARKLVENRRYINEKVFEFQDNVEVKRQNASLTLTSQKCPEGIKIDLESTEDASLWEKYCNFCIENLGTIIKSE